jgi:hypothetical protein
MTPFVHQDPALAALHALVRQFAECLVDLEASLPALERDVMGEELLNGSIDLMAHLELIHATAERARVSALRAAWSDVSRLTHDLDCLLECLDTEDAYAERIDRLLHDGEMLQAQIHALIQQALSFMNEEELEALP